MYRLMTASNQKKEALFFDTISNIETELFNGDAEKKIYFLDIEDLIASNVEQLLEKTKLWLINVDFKNCVIIVNADLSKTFSNTLWQFFYEIIKKQEDCEAAFIISNITETWSPNYAREKFGYSKPFIAESMKKIEEICVLLRRGIPDNSINNI